MYGDDRGSSGILSKSQLSSIDLREADVLIFAVLAGWLTMCFRLRPSVPWVAALVLAAGLARVVPAQADYPFRDPKLSDDQRIADLLGRLTLDEKVNLMSDHPKIPRLGIVFSGQVEGLHGLALGGPGGWGPRGKQPLPTTTFPQERDSARRGTRICSRRSRRSRATRPATTTRIRCTDFGGVVVRAPNADLSRDPRWGRTEESYGEDPFLVGTLDGGVCPGVAGARSEALAGGLADEALPGQ